MPPTPTTAPPTAALVPASQPKETMEFTPFGADESIKLTIALVKRYCAAKTKKGHEASDDDCMKFMMLCRSRKLNPFEGDAFLIGYDTDDGPKFSLVTAHQSFLKRAEVHPEYDGMRSGVIVLDANKALVDREGDFCLDTDQLVGGWATVFFKHRTHPMHRRLRLSVFQKPYGQWKTNGAGMIVKCAEADALRSAFPSLLGGVLLREEFEAGDVQVMPQAKPPQFGHRPETRLVAPPQPARIAESAEPVNTEERAPEPVQRTGEPGPRLERSDDVGEPGGPTAAAGAGESSPMSEFKPDANESEALQAVRQHAHNDRVTEGQIMAHARASGMAKPTQTKLSELSTAKLETITRAWPNILPEIRKIPNQ